jgi:hypothetical protein
VVASPPDGSDQIGKAPVHHSQYLLPFAVENDDVEPHSDFESFLIHLIIDPSPRMESDDRLDFPNFKFTNISSAIFIHLLDSSVQFVGVALPTRHLSTLFEEAEGCQSFADIIRLATSKFSDDQRLHRANTAAQQAFSEGKSLNDNAIQMTGKQIASDPINTLAAAIQVVKPRCLQVRG